MSGKLDEEKVLLVKYQCVRIDTDMDGLLLCNAVHRRICRLKGLYCLWDCRFDMYRIYREKNY